MTRPKMGSCFFFSLTFLNLQQAWDHFLKVLEPPINIIHKRNSEHLLTPSSGNHYAGSAADKGGGGGVHEGGGRGRKRKVGLR